MSNITGNTLNIGDLVFVANETVTAGCSEGWKSSVEQLKCGDDDVWQTFQCQKDCYVPELANGQFNSTSSNALAEFNSTVGTGVGLRGLCDPGMVPSGPQVITCLKNGTLDGLVDCLDPGKGVCPRPTPPDSNTTNTLKCYLDNKITRCNMTCLANHFIINGTELSTQQIVYCDTSTKEWSHKSDTNPTYQFERCTKKEDPASRNLAANLILSGSGTCPATSLLHTAFNSWLDTASRVTNSNYACLKPELTGVPICKLDSVNCVSKGDMIDYSFTIKQTLVMATDLLTKLNTQLKSDAAGNKIILPITTSKKRATTTFTSNAVSTVLNVTCSSGSASIDNLCLPCSPGYYESNAVCTLCGYGSYSTDSGVTKCLACSGTKSTIYNGANAQAFCVEGVCTIPSLYQGTTTPAEETRVLVTTDVNVDCDPGTSLGHNKDKVLKCSEQSKFVCYRKCAVTAWSSIMNLLPSSGQLEKGEAIEHGREVSVKCVGSDQTIARTCNNGTTVTFLDCTPRVSFLGKEVVAGTDTVMTCGSSIIAGQVVVSWFTDGNQITEGVQQGAYNAGKQESTLSVLNPTKDTTFICRVTTPAGVTASETAILNVIPKEPTGDASKPNVVFLTLLVLVFISSFAI